MEIKLSVWHLMGTYVDGLLLLILMSHYLPLFYHVPDTVTSVSRHAFQSPIYTSKENKAQETLLRAGEW